MNSRRLFDLTTMAWHPERWGREVVVVTVAFDQKLPFSSHSWVWAKDTRSRVLPSKIYGKKKMSTSFRPQIFENHAQLPNNVHFTSLAESQISPAELFLKKYHAHQVHQSFLMSLARRWAASNRCGLGRSTLHRKCPSVGSYRVQILSGNFFPIFWGIFFHFRFLVVVVTFLALFRWFFPKWWCFCGVVGFLWWCGVVLE